MHLQKQPTEMNQTSNNYVLKILKLSGNKRIEDIKYPIEPEEAFKQHQVE